MPSKLLAARYTPEDDRKLAIENRAFAARSISKGEISEIVIYRQLGPDLGRVSIACSQAYDWTLWQLTTSNLRAMLRSARSPRKNHQTAARTMRLEWGNVKAKPPTASIRVHSANASAKQMRSCVSADKFIFR